MTTYCECGDVATMFAETNGDPLPKPLCFDCFFFQTTMHMKHLPDQVFDDEHPEDPDLVDTFNLVEGP